VIVVASAEPSLTGIVTAITGIATVVGLCFTVIIGYLQFSKLRLETRAAARDASNRLTVIHTLVNSTLTAEIESNLDACKRELATLDELVAERTANGHDIAPETSAARSACVAKIARLTQQMADRLHSAEIVLAQERDMNPVT
jgi:hypothetical protein